MVNRWRVLEAAREIRAGAVIAYPTEAVWGLGCDPWNEEAVDRLLAIKNRSVDKGLILAGAASGFVAGMGHRCARHGGAAGERSSTGAGFVRAGGTVDFYLSQPSGPPGGTHADSCGAVFPRAGGFGFGWCPGWTQEPQPDSRFGNG